MFLVGILLLYIAVRPVFSPYLIGSADGFAHKYRLVNFDQAISEGTLRPRWIGNAVLGYGAPLFIFNYAVPYYLVDSIYRFGFSIQTSSQLYAALTLITAFLTMYLLASRLWGRGAGIVAAAVYTFAPYHLFTVYSYEAWGEMLAFVFPPLILWSLSKSWYAATIVTWVLFIMTHNISSFMMSPVILLLAFCIGKRDGASLFYLLKIAILVIMMSSFFLLPAVALTDTIKIPALLAKEIAMRKNYMIPLIEQLHTAYTALLGQHIEYKNFTVGVPIIGILCIGTLTLIWPGVKRTLRPIGLSLLGLLVLSLFFVSPVSNIFYAFLPLQYILYPYRFLFLATFSGSLLAGYFFKKSIPAGISIMILAVIFGYPFTHPYLEIFPFPQSYFSQPQMLGYAVPTLKTMGVSEFLPKTADISFLLNQEHTYLATGTLPKKFIIPEGFGNVIAQTVRQESLSATINAKQNILLTISTLYYPDWQATIDGTSVPVGHDQHGRIVLSVPAGIHRITLHFGYSTIETVGIIISLCGIGLFISSLFL